MSSIIRGMKYLRVPALVGLLATAAMLWAIQVPSIQPRIHVLILFAWTGIIVWPIWRWLQHDPGFILDAQGKPVPMLRFPERRLYKSLLLILGGMFSATLVSIRWYSNDAPDVAQQILNTPLPTVQLLGCLILLLCCTLGAWFFLDQSKEDADETSTSATP